MNPRKVKRWRPEGFPHVLVVSNYWQAQEEGKILSFAGQFVESQVMSLKNAGVPLSTFDIGVSHSPLRLLGKWIKLRQEVRRLNPALVHGQFGTIIAFLSVFAGRPVVVSFCGPDLLDGAPISFVRREFGHLLSNIAALRASAIICKSEELRQALWWRRDRAVVIPNGVDLCLFTPGKRHDARVALGWDIQCPTVLIVVRDDPENKGLDLAKASVEFVKTRIPHVELQVVRNVRHDRMPMYFRAADVLLCASKVEGSPNVVKEALACNLPIVSVPVGDVAERLANVSPSAVVPRDPTLIGKALANILLERKRSNGRDHVGHLALDQVAQRVLDVYRLALEPNGKE
jgi:glycosyltransferase involved in cell wall biosynthesis